MSRTVKIVIIVIAVLVVIFFGMLGMQIWVKIYPDWLWFKSQSINLLSVFLTTLKAKLGLGIGFGLIALVLTLGNLILLWRFALRSATIGAIPVGQDQVTVGKRLILVVLIAVCVFSSVIGGIWAVGQWEPYLRFTNSDQLSFSSIDPVHYKDPIFKNDIAYYVFKIPFLRFVWGWFFTVFLFTTLGAGIIYALVSGFLSERFKTRFPLHIRVHLFVLFSITLLLLAWGRVFAMYDLLAPATRHGWVYGVGYTDATARIPVYRLTMYITILSAVLFLVAIFVRRMTRFAIGAVGLFVLVAFLGGGIYPWIIQKFQVDPQELDKERKYIENDIIYTRKAYNLDKIEEKPYKGTGKLTLEDITQNRAIMDNIRLWDWRPLLKTFKQREARRLQYDFTDVDVDRYILDGRIRQVMLSARELIFSKVKPESQTWMNRTFVYTHGYGLTMIPVSEIEEGGLPIMYIDYIPPKTHAPWRQEITKPEIYYGEGEQVAPRSEIKALPYVIVNPSASVPEEFDYPKEPSDVYTSYQGIGGVPITSFWRRLAFAFKFSDDTREILFSGKIRNTSKILFNRSISECVRTIAPFLKYDKDPYLVVSDGRLYWIQDAYTTTYMYPYSEPMMEEVTEVLQGRPRTTRQRVWGNYIRNSVKVVIDAYDGIVTYYLMTGEKGQEDPIAECYRKIFPNLFKDFRSMPDDLKKHIRYPIALFMIQAGKYTSYHMKDPKQFYYKEDAWQFGTEKYQPDETAPVTERPVEPYYVVLQLPDSKKEEFMLMLPFTPFQKPNMISWLAAKCDTGKNSDLGEYGNLLVYNFPKGELVDGPIQIEAYIDQDPEMSSAMTLWGQRGSRVIRGNLLSIPIKDTILYVEPIYLESDLAKIPELRKVVIAQARKLDWGDNLEEALAVFFGPAVPAKAPAEAQVQPAKPEVAKEAIPEKDMKRKAMDHFNQAQKYLRAGDWAKYGEEMEKLKEALELLQVTP